MLGHFGSPLEGVLLIQDTVINGNALSNRPVRAKTIAAGAVRIV
jgi:hypothetical protein